MLQCTQVFQFPKLGLQQTQQYRNNEINLMFLSYSNLLQPESELEKKSQIMTAQEVSATINIYFIFQRIATRCETVLNVFLSTVNIR